MSDIDPAAGDYFFLQRFIAAQESENTYDQALTEIRNGRKVTHWMWFVYPQHVGLGQSHTAKLFGITCLDEAHEYVSHAALGRRLRECAWAAADLEIGRIEHVFGSVDTIKLRSSMTLFEVADPDEPSFKTVLDRHFNGQRDQATLDLLAAERR